MTRLLEGLDRQLGHVARLFAIIGALGVFVLMGITVVGVFWRYVLRNPIFGLEDLSVITLTIVAGGAVAYGTSTGAHVSVDLISRLGPGLTRITDTVMRALAAGICLLAAYGLFNKACGLERACITENMSIEHEKFYYFLGISMGVMGLTYLSQLLTGLARWGRADPEQIAD